MTSRLALSHHQYLKTWALGKNPLMTEARGFLVPRIAKLKTERPYHEVHSETSVIPTAINLLFPSARYSTNRKHISISLQKDFTSLRPYSTCLSRVCLHTNSEIFFEKHPICNKKNVFLNGFRLLNHPSSLAQLRSNSSKKRSNKPAMNEQLVRLLTTPQATKDVVQVRLIVDQGRGVAPDVSISSLSKAVKVAEEKKVDLVGISNIRRTTGRTSGEDSDRNLPVVKVVNYNELLYQMKKKKKKDGMNDNGVNSVKKTGTKEFKFKCGIAEHDLLRKASNCLSYLRKGYPCKISIFANNYSVRMNNNIVQETFAKVKDLLKEDAEQGKVRQNSENHATVMLQPKKK